MTREAGPSSKQGFPRLDAFSSDLGQIIERIQPSVVQVRSGERGAGTGVIWHENGSIITNHHVVASAGRKLQVELQDGRVLNASVVESEPTLDVALLKVTAENLKAAPTDDSAKVRVGELVFAIGNPWGQRGVITAGIVSALSKVQTGNGKRTMEYIKSDVRLAPGNSGGPLLNAEGNVIGINAMIMGGDLSVAIPSNVVNAWVAQLPQSRISLGVQLQRAELPTSIRQALGTDKTLGLLVVGIIEGSLAAHADLLVGDILLEIAGTSLHDVATLRTMLAAHSSQETVRLRVLRAGVLVDVEVVLTTQEPRAA